MNPRKILLFLISVLGILALIAISVPADGFLVFGSRLKYPSLDGFMSYRPVIKSEKTIQKTAQLDKEFKKIQADSIKKHKNAPLDGTHITADTSAEEVSEDGLVRISFPEGEEHSLDDFFAKLSNASANKKSIRIIHYGDSQIEGDRMTAYMRNRIQSKFGGYGPGLAAFFNVYNTQSFVQQRSTQWKRYTSFPAFAKGVPHKRYGVMCSFARFTPVINDSSYLKNEETEAWVEIGRSKSAYGTAQEFSRVKIFYGNCRVPVSVNVYNGEELIHTDTLKYDGATHVFELTFDKTPDKLKYVFKGKDSPDFYCFALDGAYGVGMDNIAMRGSSGTFVTTSDMSHLKVFYDNLGTELFIMQFGGNAVPYLKDSAAARTIANYFSTQLSALKRLRPGSDVIVIGPSDMSQKINGEWRTYPLLPAFIGYLKQAAHKAGAGYWDMYTAMGGENSMVTWVEKNWAGPDYTHFSPYGAKLVGESFYKAFILEYNKFLKSKKEI
jgi:lysophospholipase L1-like esterase